MITFSDAFEVPIIEKIGGNDITFPLLNIDDYLPWIAEITAHLRDVARQKLPKTITGANGLPQQVDAQTKWQLEQRIETIDIGLPNVAEQVWTVAGSKRVLDISLTKARYDEKDRKEILKRVPPRRLHELAVEVSALFQKRVNGNADNGEAKNPNPSSPAAASEKADGGTSSTSESK